MDFMEFDTQVRSVHQVHSVQYVHLTHFASRQGRGHRHLLHDLNPEAFERGHATWMVSQQAISAEIRVGEDLCSQSNLTLSSPLIFGTLRTPPLVLKRECGPADGYA